MSVESIYLSQPLDARSVVWRPSTSLWVLLLAILLVSIYPFYNELSFMWGWWMDRPEFSHGVLMPVLAAFLLWQQRERLERLPFANNAWGVVLTVIGGLLFLMGKLGSVMVLVQYAYVVTLGGLALSLMSWQGARCLWVPFAILILMVPVPEFVLKNMTADLQLISSKLAVMFIRAAGVSVFLEGNVIDLGATKLQVAEACSGLRYLFPLMTLGFVMAYFFKANMWKRVWLFVSSIPITIFMNSLRIAFVGVTVDWWGPQMAEGFLHDFEGWLIFMASAIVLILEIVILNRLQKNHRPWREVFGVTLPAPVSTTAPRQYWQPTTTFIVSCGLLAMMCAYQWLAPQMVEQVLNRQNLSQFPVRVSDWSGTRVPMEREYLDELKLDDYIVANYSAATQLAVSSSNNLPINFYVAWYNSQRGGQSSHSPRTCLPGGGWRITSLERVGVENTSIAERPLFVNRALIENGPNRQLVYYWFQQRGRAITNEYAVKWYLFWDSLWKGRTDGALVRLIVSIPEGQSLNDADQQLQSFIRTIAPGLPAYIPN